MNRPIMPTNLWTQNLYRKRFVEEGLVGFGKVIDILVHKLILKVMTSVAQLYNVLSIVYSHYCL